jgi:hypothetical protein
MNITEDNRRIVTEIFAELGRGNPRAFADALADDVRWTTPGNIPGWPRSFEGKAAVLDQLLAQVRAQLVERIRLTVSRILADGEHVIVEAKGRATTRTGYPYNNEYCFLYRLSGGKIVEVTEYLDTQLASAVLTPPPAAPAAS